MSTTLIVKLRTQAAAYAPLTALLGSGAGPSTPFKWYDVTLDQNRQGPKWPAVVVQQVSEITRYMNFQRDVITLNRVQFTCWDLSLETTRNLALTLKQFFDVFNGYNTSGSRPPNRVVLSRQAGEAQTDPITYAQVVDVEIYHNESL